MLTKNKGYAFLQKKVTGCRRFWGFMYTMLFISSCISFHSTKIWGDDGVDTYLRMSIYAAISFIIYWLLFMVIPLAYLIHQVVKENVGCLKFGETSRDTAFKFLLCSTFPVFSIYMGGVFEDVESMWCCVYLVGSLLCLVMCYVNPSDYGLSYAFLGLWLGIFVHLDRPFAKLVMLIVVGVSFLVSQLWKNG